MKEIFSKENMITFVLVVVACTVAIIVGVPLANSIKSKLTPAPAAPATGGA